MTVTEVTPHRTDAERFGHILAVQRAAYLRDGAPSLAARRGDLPQAQGGTDRPAQRHRGGDQHRLRKPLAHETAMMELGGVVQGIDYLQRNLRRFMRPRGRHTAWHMRLGTNRIEYQPLGVVGVISPWNYPVNLPLSTISSSPEAPRSDEPS